MSPRTFCPRTPPFHPGRTVALLVASRSGRSFSPPGPVRTASWRMPRVPD